ncbi:MAG: M28 family peptidase [Rhizobacter sp.]|nr:M28 family peptidase [Ferruginibacter sp.]
MTDYLPEQNYFGRSDNYPFALNGVPANIIMSGNGYDRFYHSPGDEWQTLDYGLMAISTQAITLATIPQLKK